MLIMQEQAVIPAIVVEDVVDKDPVAVPHCHRVARHEHAPCSWLLLLL